MFQYFKKTYQLFRLGLMSERLPDYVLQEALARSRALERSYYLFYVGYIDAATKIIGNELKKKNKIDALSAHHYFQCLLLSSPDKLSHQAYLKSILKITSLLLPYNNNFNFRKIIKNNKKIKIGYICHFVSSNIMQASLWEWVKRHDKNRFEVWVLSDDRKACSEPNDKYKWNLFKSKVNFVDTSDMDIKSYCDFIRNNNFSIVVEMNGHCLVSRYEEINQRIAPIQISFFNISGPSGVLGIDYIFYCGEPEDIKPIEPFFTEKFIKIDSSATQVNFNDYYPDVSSPPFQKNNFITFGSFGAIHKVHIKHFKLWCEILKKVPMSKFFLKAAALDDVAIRKIWEQHFISNGIGLDRVKIEGFEQHSEMLNKYSEVDIALDTFPHGAGTTTIDALYMGVPVIALNGERLCSQHGRVIIGNRFGRPELVAKNETDYVNKAVNLAQDLDRLIYYRKVLREDFLKSPNSNISNFIQSLEKTYEIMWKNYLNDLQ